MKLLPFLVRVWCAFAICLSSAYAQQLSPHSEGRPDFAWAQVTKFSGSDQPYIALRRAFTTQIAKGVDPLTLYRKHLPEATKGNLKALFLLGLSAQQNMKDGQTVWLERHRLVLRTLDLFEKVPQLPQTYEFTRVRFLLDSQGQLSYARELIPIGERLLREQPEDPEVEVRLLRVKLHQSRGPEEWRKILKRAVTLQSSPTTRGAARSLMSSVYTRLANTGMDSTARDKEIALYEQGLSEYQRRPQTPRVKEDIRNTTHLLNYARKHRS